MQTRWREQALGISPPTNQPPGVLPQDSADHHHHGPGHALLSAPRYVQMPWPTTSSPAEISLANLPVHQPVLQLIEGPSRLRQMRSLQLVPDQIVYARGQLHQEVVHV